MVTCEINSLFSPSSTPSSMTQNGPTVHETGIFAFGWMIVVAWTAKSRFLVSGFLFLAKSTSATETQSHRENNANELKSAIPKEIHCFSATPCPSPNFQQVCNPCRRKTRNEKLGTALSVHHNA